MPDYDSYATRSYESDYEPEPSVLEEALRTVVDRHPLLELVGELNASHRGPLEPHEDPLPGESNADWATRIAAWDDLYAALEDEVLDMCHELEGPLGGDEDEEPREPEDDDYEEDT